MKIGWRDGVATLLVSAVVVPYIGYLVKGSMPFIHDPRGMAATALVLGLAAAAVLGREAFRGTWGVARSRTSAAADRDHRPLPRCRTGATIRWTPRTHR